MPVPHAQGDTGGVTIRFLRANRTISGPPSPRGDRPPRSWPGGLAAHTSLEQPPGQSGVEQRGFTGGPSGIIVTQCHT